MIAPHRKWLTGDDQLSTQKSTFLIIAYHSPNSETEIEKRPIFLFYYLIHKRNQCTKKRKL